MNDPFTSADYSQLPGYYFVSGIFVVLSLIGVFFLCFGAVQILRLPSYQTLIEE